MFEVFKPLAVYILPKIKLNGLISTLHYRTTNFILNAIAMFILGNWFISNKISCVFSKTDWVNFINAAESYCLIHHYIIPDEKEAGLRSHPGVSQLDRTSNVTYYHYYVWIPLVCVIQALLFRLPQEMWSQSEGGRIKKMTKFLDETLLSEEDKAKKKERIVNYIMMYLEKNQLYGLSYMFCQSLTFANVVLQAYLINVLLGYEFTTYGWSVLQFIRMDHRNRTDPMALLFPKVSKCTFNMFGPGGSLQPHDGVCVLPLNVFYETAYTVIWFWFAILSVLTAIDLLLNLATMCCRSLRYLKLRLSSPYTDPRKLHQLCKQFQLGDWLLIYLLGKNIDEMLFKELLEDLAIQLKSKKVRLAKKKDEEDSMYAGDAELQYCDTTIQYNELVKVSCRR